MPQTSLEVHCPKRRATRRHVVHDERRMSQVEIEIQRIVLPGGSPTSGDCKLIVTGTVRLPLLPFAPMIWIWLLEIVAPAVPSKPTSGFVLTTSETSPGLPLIVMTALVYVPAGTGTLPRISPS